MAKLPQIKRLAKEDFPDLEGIEKLLQPLNEFMESVVLALNNQLTIAENLIGVERTINLRTDSGGAVVETPRFAWPLKQRVPRHAWVTNVVTRSGTIPAGTVGILWSFDGTSISITQVTGLAASSEYIISIIILGS